MKLHRNSAFVAALLVLSLGVAPAWGVSKDMVQLQTQVQQLQERIRVLERIVTDRGAETAAQIEALRDHDRIAEEDKA